MVLHEALPEEYIAQTLSHTNPLDACRLSLVSKSFYSATESDVVWNPFIPSDMMSIISRSDLESSFLSNFPSKKSLYLALSQHPIIIDQATKSFQLDIKSGKKCYMLGARALHIVWGDKPHYWNWTSLPESRFPEVAQLLEVCWLQIYVRINKNVLSPNTHYAAYFVFQMLNAYGFHHNPAELTISIYSGQTITKNVCLDPNLECFQGLQRPNVRSDGWLEIEIGEFFNLGLEDGEAYMNVAETRRNLFKRGLFVEGIEVRPKEGN